MAMKAVEMTGTIDEHRELRLDEPLPFNGPNRVRVIILMPEEGDPSEEEWVRAAASNPAFAFLRDPAEDIYNISDGKPFRDKE
jgi:hypothetical protein